jgi:hypothetical protein
MTRRRANFHESFAAARRMLLGKLVFVRGGGSRPCAGCLNRQIEGDRLMKAWIVKFGLATAGLLACLAVPVMAAEGAMTDAERAYLLDQLQQSKKEMLASIQGLTAAQWKFKPAPAVWSVAECAEHIVLAEDFIFTGSQMALKSPAAPRLEHADADHDHGLVAAVKDRSRKATAPEPITPAGKFDTPDAAMREFTTRRDKTIAYVKSTNDDLRAHAADGPAGKMDAYQFLLLLAAHSSRHTAQILEVEANANYPKALP